MDRLGGASVADNCAPVCNRQHVDAIHLFVPVIFDRAQLCDLWSRAIGLDIIGGLCDHDVGLDHLVS